MKNNEKKQPAGSLRRLIRLMRGSRGLLLLAVFCAIASVAFSLVSPLLVGRGIDSLAGENTSSLSETCLWLGGIYVLSAGVLWLLNALANTISYRVTEALRTQAFGKLHRLPLSAIDSVSHGDLLQRVTQDAEAVGDGLIAGLSRFLTGIAAIIGTLILLISLSPWIALTVAVLTPLSVLVAKRITLRSHLLFREQSRVSGAMTGYVNEHLSDQTLIDSFDGEKEELRGFDALNGELKLCGYKAQLYGALVNPLTRFVNHLVYVAVGIVGAVIALQPGALLTVGNISACLTYANQYTSPFNEISSVMTQLQAALAGLRRVLELIDMKEEKKDTPVLSSTEENGTRGLVEFRDISFAYDKTVPLIEHLSFTALPGQKIAIVGPTGAGKTTLVNLLMRFYDPDGGDILIDGKSILHMDRDSARSMFGMVLQDSWLFEGTVAENIAFGARDATRDRIISAAKEAHADSFISRLKDGYDTLISENSGLSEGQKQLICISRVMLRNAPLLILDEATSSIDTRTEQRVNRAFDKLTAGRTSFVVAHRLSTIREASIILVMDKGHVVEQGTHSELLKKGGFYSRLYQSQFVGQNAPCE